MEHKLTFGTRKDHVESLRYLIAKRKEEYQALRNEMVEIYLTFLRRAVAEYEEFENQPLWCCRCQKTTDYRQVVPIRERPIKYFGYWGPDFNTCVHCHFCYDSQDNYPRGSHWEYQKCEMCGAEFYQRGQLPPRFDAGYDAPPWCSFTCMKNAEEMRRATYYLKELKLELQTTYQKENAHDQKNVGTCPR